MSFLPTRIIGNAKLFRLNKKNPFVQKLVKLDWELTKLETSKIVKKNLVEA